MRGWVRGRVWGRGGGSVGGWIGGWVGRGWVGGERGDLLLRSLFFLLPAKPRSGGKGWGLARAGVGLVTGKQGCQCFSVCCPWQRWDRMPPTSPKRCGVARLVRVRRCGERAHSAGAPTAPLDVARRALRMHVRAGARLRPACVQAHNAHVPCGYAGGKPRVNLRCGRVGFGGRGPRRADL